MRHTTFGNRFGRYGSTSVLGMLVVGAFLVLGGAAQAQAPDVTFAKDVASILQEKCEACHRTGQMAPMSLTTYAEVRPWARAIRTKVVAGDMPPWHMSKTTGIQKFVNDISLTTEQIDTIVRWVDAGAPLGNPDDLPPTREWPSGERWRVGSLLGRDPDLIVTSTPWTQPAEGQDQWWQPVVDSGMTEDRWIKAVEVRPTIEGRRIVHHGNSALAEFAVGKAGEIYPDDTGRLLKAGEKVRFDIHYHSVGEEITDYLSIGVWFYPKDVVPKYVVKHSPMGVFQAMDTFDLPPHTVTKHHAFIPLETATRILSYQPHMHVRGKSMSLEAIYPTGRVEMLSYVENFNFNWHVNYVYADDVAPLLPAGTMIKLTAWHDNTAGNRANPDPTQWVGWGQRSYDDMYHAHVRYIELTEEDYKQMVQDRRRAATTNNDQ
ncbi:MAG TPA: cytochrome c [Acidobacteria bacterium]|nr:cytochrome c [Acidobacteriota bacterium]